MKNIDKKLEQKLWTAADELRGNISSENYMHVVVGILFLKYMSEKYDNAVEQIKIKYKDKWKGIANDVGMLSSFGCSFIIPQKASWNYITENASTTEIGTILDNAFVEIEDKNQNLKGLFDKEYNSEEIDQGRLGRVVSNFTEINLAQYGEDIIGRIYEYFLGEFFKKQGQKGGEFFTPKCVVQVLTDILDVKEGNIYDPCFGTGGMFIQSKKHMKEKGYDINKLLVFGQEFQTKTWKIARINLIINGFNINDTHLATPADTLLDDQHKSLNDVDYALANPPFNQKKWGKEELQEDPRFEFGLASNANYAWIQHILSKLNPKGKAGIVLANGSLSASGKEAKIRIKMVESGIVDAIISLPDKLFYTTGIPACIWIFNKNKKSDKVLMINGSELKGEMISKKLRELTSKEIEKFVSTYKKHNNGKEVEEIGYAKSVSIKELKENSYSFVPGRYVGWVEEKIDKKTIKKEVQELSKEIDVLFDELQELIPKVKESIKKVTK